MKSTAFLVLALAVGLAPQAIAADFVCPDLAQAVQVAACPTDEELRYTFTGFCSDNNRSYKGDTDVCTDFERYRKLKNLALWESGDGNFSAYVSCDRPPGEVKAMQVNGVRIARQGRINVLICSYGEGVSFSHRTRAECRISAAAACSGDASTCKASCD